MSVVAPGEAEETVLPLDAAGPKRWRRWLVAAVVLVLVAGGGTAAWQAGAFTGPGKHGPGNPYPTSTRPVTRQTITAQTSMSGILGFSGSYTVTGKGHGSVTWLPQAGHVVRDGRTLYKVDNGVPVVLLYGTVPEWRVMSEGTTGADVAQLNHDLVALGDASSGNVAGPGWDYFSAATGSGVQRLEEHLGVTSPAASLSPGQVVFEPGAIRVTQVTGSLGGPAARPVRQTTSDQQVVSIALDTAQESQVAVGDKVSVTLPGGSSTPGVVAFVGTVATSTAGQGGSGSTTTIPVTVTLTDPGAAGTLDQAPVTVHITTATSKDVLAVPVTALQARPGGYVVEVTGPGGTRHWVPVSAGPVFDDNSGLVEVDGALTPGQRVVVASS